jgi:hypothetical protein
LSPDSLVNLLFTDRLQSSQRRSLDPWGLP